MVTPYQFSNKDNLVCFTIFELHKLEVLKLI